MNKHTPGPWKFRRVLTEKGTLAVILETQHRPVYLNDPAIFAIREDWLRTFDDYGKTFYHADHRLIEAAPDLLEALKYFCTDVEKNENFGDWFEAGLNQARLAIEKAEGKSV